MKNILLLGATGSIGDSALDVIFQNPESLNLYGMAFNSNIDKALDIANKFFPDYAYIENSNHQKTLIEKVHAKTEILSGKDELHNLLNDPKVDVIISAISGFSGLETTLMAAKTGKTILLANKESIVVAGDIILPLAKEFNTNVIPIDSEHNAIFQCLVGERAKEDVSKIIITASGGPFINKSLDELEMVTKEQALKHPNWEMGAKITIDSASLMNKGLEVIEAKWLFDLTAEQIDVIVHPQSIIHSAVQFEDGSIKAQLGVPDMKLPIQYALGFPERLKNTFKRFSFMDYPNLTFEKPDLETFRNLQLAYNAMEKGGNMPCILNAANEIAVAAFLKDKIGFLNMSDLIADCMEKITFVSNPTLEDYVETNKETRILANELL